MRLKIELTNNVIHLFSQARSEWSTTNQEQQCPHASVYEKCYQILYTIGFGHIMLARLNCKVLTTSPAKDNRLLIWL